MRITSDSPLVQAAAKHLNVPPSEITGFCLIVGMGDQTAILHTFCCHHHMAKEVAEIVNEPYLDLTVTEN